MAPSAGPLRQRLRRLLLIPHPTGKLRFPRPLPPRPLLLRCRRTSPGGRISCTSSVSAPIRIRVRPSNPRQAATVADADYIIGPGDQIGISVWRDENLTRTVVVLPDGKIYFPLIGEIVAGGKTVSQLKQELEKKLSRYVSDTGVTVEVKQSNSMIIYVIGRVNAPGQADAPCPYQCVAGPRHGRRLESLRRQGEDKDIPPGGRENRHVSTSITTMFRREGILRRISISSGEMS